MNENMGRMGAFVQGRCLSPLFRPACSFLISLIGEELSERVTRLLHKPGVKRSNRI